VKKIPGLTIIVLLTIFVGQTALAGGMGFSVKTGQESATNSYNFTYQNKTPLRDHLYITNEDKNNPTTIHLTGVDGLSNEIGQSYFRNSNEKQLFLGKWIKFKINDIVLEPGASQIVDFSINVPPDAPPGLYGGGIAIQNTSTPPPVGTSEPTAGFSVKVATRLVKKIYLQMPGAVVSEAEVTNFNFAKDNTGKGYFNFDVNNKGNTLISFKGNISIEGGINNTNTKISVPVDIGTIQGHTSIHEQFALPGSGTLWGSYEAKLDLTATEYSPFTNTYKEIKKFNLHTALQLIPWNYILFVAILLILIIILIIYIIVSKRNYLKHCEYCEIKEGDTLKGLAECHGMSWQKLVKINKLSAPYELKPTSKILVRKIDEKK
jgi:uncharacterized protein YdeI (BOF family)